MEGEALVQVVQVAAQTGSNVLLVILVALLISGRLVPRWVFDAMKDDRDAWRKTAQEQGATARTVAPVAEKNADLAGAMAQAVIDVMQKKGSGS